MNPRLLPLVLVFVSFLFAGQLSAQSPNTDARTLLEEAADAMGGLEVLRGLENQVIVSEGRQFEPEQSLVPNGPGRHVADFTITVVREPANQRVRIDWNGRRYYPRDNPVRYVEVINGSKGFLEEPGGQGDIRKTPLHAARLASRLREERRAAAQVLLTALASKDIKRLPDRERNGRRHRVIGFQDGGNEFEFYLDTETRLPAQVAILENDPVYGDSRFVLRYGDWRQVDGLMIPFLLRYEINGRLLQVERHESVWHNVKLPGETFSIPESIGAQQSQGRPVASQWLLRRLAMNVSYAYFAAEPPVDLVSLADGVVHVRGASHQPVIIEMEDYLVVVEAPLYQERSAQTLEAIKVRFPDKPVRYIIPTHFHNDHNGGIRTYIADGATIVAPAVSVEYYQRVARAPHTSKPDRLQKNPREPEIEVNPGRKIITDGRRRIEVHHYPTSHAEDLQLIYLPQEGLLVEADHVSPREGRVRPGPLPREVFEAIQKLKLDVKQIAGIHGAVGTMEQLRIAVAGGSR